MALPQVATALHMGALHTYEQALVLALAFGPFVVLGAVIVQRRRHDAAQDDLEDQRDR
ncbi:MULTISPECIES: hypothetical protein [unclassified Nocardioides]|uniref:hypothetical protein n=1 Tax=unclassified Nocardioides TaxID=2615069 RepID=UPI00360A26A6